MLSNDNVNKMNNLLDQLNEVREELAKVNALKKRQRLLEKTIKAILLEEGVFSYENTEFTVVITKEIKDKITEEKVIEIIELFDSNQLDSLALEDFFVPKESISMKIKKKKSESINE